MRDQLIRICRELEIDCKSFLLDDLADAIMDKVLQLKKDNDFLYDLLTDGQKEEFKK